MAEKREVLKTWELSLYELQRRPQEAVTDETEIKINPRILHSELMCPICLDVMSNTMTTKECLHRFCSECIVTALRNGNKECPTCRNKLVSKRSLRRDPNFDALISKICPSNDNDVGGGGGGHNSSFMSSPADSPLNHQDDHDDNNMDESGNHCEQTGGRRKRLSRSSTAPAGEFNESFGDATNTSSNRKSLKRDNSSDTATTKSAKTSTANANTSNPSKTSIDIILRLKPPNAKISTDGNNDDSQEQNPESQTEESSNETAAASTSEQQTPICKFLKTTRDASIEHLAVYMKLRKEEIKEVLKDLAAFDDLDNNKIEFFVKKRQSSPVEFIQMKKDFTLSQIVSDFNMPKNRPLELFFNVTLL